MTQTAAPASANPLSRETELSHTSANHPPDQPIDQLLCRETEKGAAMTPTAAPASANPLSRETELPHTSANHPPDHPRSRETELPHTPSRRDSEPQYQPEPYPLPGAYSMVWQGVGKGHVAMPLELGHPGSGEVLVEILAATICGSDLHTLSGRRPQVTPAVLGHEQVGRVLAAGPGAVKVDGTAIEPGERIVWSVTGACGRCDRCVGGLSQKCRRLSKFGHESWPVGVGGGFATHALIRAGTAVVAVPATLPDAVAAPAACAFATAAACVESLEAASCTVVGEKVLVSGAGMLGLGVTAMLSDLGALVTTVDPDRRRRQMAAELGADLVASPERLPGLGVGWRLPRPANSMAEGDYRATVELAGSAKSVAACLAGLAVGGVCVLAGSVAPGAGLLVDPQDLVRGLVTVKGVHNYGPWALQRAVDFLAGSGADLPFAELLGGPFTLDALDEALDQAQD
ncbi:MAG: alcohol dehydrogenase catalytic domain-containing protein, partial [Micrococcales bacterium]|nr:alcohol dehydrogenase catalytic domain-containing protein [Micrococcales bacterium]